MHRLCLVVLAGIGLSGCASSGPVVVSPATPADKAALFDRIKSLEGDWMMKDESGKMILAANFHTTSNGTCVRETMFPGQPHEMTNMYTMDGDALLFTHYCAMGNQPHMKARAGAKDSIDFKRDSVSNLNDANASYMGEMTLVFKDKDHVEQHWHSIKGTQRTNDHDPVFELERKK